MNEEHGPLLTISLELQSTGCRVFQNLAEQNIQQSTLVDIRRLSNGNIRHLMRIPTDQIPIGSLQQVFPINDNYHNRHTLLWFESEDCQACQTIILNNSFQITGTSVNKDVILVNFVVAEHQDFQQIISSFEKEGLKLRVLEMSKRVCRDSLSTNKQERAVQFAGTFGFFDYPRSITLFNLAKKLGIASSTLSEQLRRGTRRLVENYITIYQ